MADFCCLFNELATKANEVEALKKEIEGIALPVVWRAVDNWNGFGNDWKIRSYRLEISSKRINLIIDRIENAGRFPVKPLPGEISVEEASVMKDFISKAFADEIPDFAPFYVITP